MYRTCHVYPAWYARARTSLSQGAWLRLPRGLPHPATCGFRPIVIAEDHAQVADWGSSLPGGSRLHVHEHADGSLVAHRDRYDPGQDPLSAVAHVLFETRLGHVACAVAAAAAVGALLAAVLK